MDQRRPRRFTFQKTRIIESWKGIMVSRARELWPLPYLVYEGSSLLVAPNVHDNSTVICMRSSCTFFNLSRPISREDLARDTAAANS